MSLPLYSNDSSGNCPAPQSLNISLVDTLQIPAMSEIEVMARAEEPVLGGVWMIERGVQDRTPVTTASALVKPTKQGFPVRLLNSRSESVTVYKGTKIGLMELVEETAAKEAQLPCNGVMPRTAVDITDETRDVLWDLVKSCEADLSAEQEQQFFLLLLSYADVFATTKTDFGRTTRLKHAIHTGDNPPVKQRARRLPPHQKEEVHRLLQDMLAKDVIQTSSSPWASPIVLAKKKDGTSRFCIDYRKLNSITRKDAYPLPRMDDTLDLMSGSKWFSTLDMISGYWQVELEPQDREKTAFCTTEGLFQFNVMPFGLCNAPATFQRLMDLVLSGLLGPTCLVYIDDIVIFGRDFLDHLKGLQSVLQRIREAGMKVKPSKCTLLRKQVTFLGHVVSEKGIATDPQKTAKVANWPVPTSTREVQQFLGLANYYRRFIKGFAQIAKPLHKLTEHAIVFKWSNDCQEAFEELRRRLITAPVLAYPNYSKPFILDTDASNIGIGAVLSQLGEDGLEHVIGYTSRLLTKPERRYCVTRKELLAVVVFTQQFRPYLLGEKFLLRTDHHSLKWLQNFKEPEGQLARWLEKLQQFQFEIVHRPGIKHGNADALSRIPCRQCGREDHHKERASILSVEHTSQPLAGSDRNKMMLAQQDDPSIRPVLDAKSNSQKPSPDLIKGLSLTSRRLFLLWDQLCLDHGLLCRNYENGNGIQSHLQIVVPKKLQPEVLQEIHGGVLGGHLGEDKTMSKLKQRFY